MYYVIFIIVIVCRHFAWLWFLHSVSSSPPKQKVAIMHKLIPSNEEGKTGEEESGGQPQIDRAEKIR